MCAWIIKIKNKKGWVEVEDVRWELYPLVASSELARAWLQMQAHLQLAPKTIDAYGRCLNDFLGFCEKHQLSPQEMSREHLALYVHDLATRPNPKGANILSFHSGVGLANATMQQRITVVRLYCDYLMEKQLRPDNPVGRGHFVPGKGFAGIREREGLSLITNACLGYHPMSNGRGCYKCSSLKCSGTS